MQPEFKTTQERIRYIFEQTGQLQKDFAETLGIRQPHLSGVMATKKPSKRLLLTISEKTGASVQWLETGEGDIYRKHLEDPPELARVIDQARQIWDDLEDDAERFEMAANMLRALSSRNNKKKSTTAAKGETKKD